MTTAADDRAVEEAFEASLAGRPVPAEAAGLAAFTRAVRGTATEPGRPSAALADLLSTGLLTDQSSPSARTAPAAGSLPSRSTRSRTRRRFAMIFPALLAKFLSAGAVAQAATGAGVVVVVVAGAGATGTLPGGAQDTFDDIAGISEVDDQPTDDLTDDEQEPVEGEDGGSADPAVPPAPPVAEVPVAAPVDEQVDDDVDADDQAGDSAEVALTQEQWLDGPADGQSFGEWVSIGRHKGWATGSMSGAAHERNEDRKHGSDDSDDSDEQESDDSGNDSPSDLDDDSDDSDDSSDDDSHSDEDRSGSGKSGSGSSNSGKGSSNSGKGNRN